ncbi:MAG TPA: hypothetical protein VFV33_00900, partial [Gemmatimonadaceae bacterium]|nr:hypothetical protein [Gemmatimonadaceae bacterium]
MKRILFLAMLVSTGALAQQTISTSKHNFGSQTNAPNAYTTGETQICKYCHVPHKALTTGSLWSHTATTATYTAYGTTQRGTA